MVLVLSTPKYQLVYIKYEHLFLCVIDVRHEVTNMFEEHVWFLSVAMEIRKK